LLGLGARTKAVDLHDDGGALIAGRGGVSA